MSVDYIFSDSYQKLSSKLEEVRSRWNELKQEKDVITKKFEEALLEVDNNLEECKKHAKAVLDKMEELKKGSPE